MHRSTYSPLRDVEQEESAVSWKKFFVILAGNTQGAHVTIVEKLKSSGQTEVQSPERSDYLLLFCPVASRVGTDIGEALETVPDGKPIILVVMHHTFNPNCVVAESRRQVNNQNVRLTVDYLFHEGKLLTCSRNDHAWSEIKRFLGVSGSWIFSWQTCRNLCKWLCDWRRLPAAVLAVSMFLWTKGSEKAVTDGSTTEH
ncbi:uncharacterized protein LOC143335861 [Chaetodon auriga]|uniref:uncharacterized protein LOC143335861 n=1 Tax=Chaetodon auriga TaxID=39042 RepID=UPI004033037F